MSLFRRRSEIVELKLARVKQWQDKKPIGALELFRLPPLHPTWWKIISDGAKAGSDRAHVAIDVTFANIDDPAVPEFPLSIEDWDTELPAIRQDEALALLEKLLVAESGDLLPGVSIHSLHWLAVTAHYCTKREPINALKELVAAGRLQAGNNTPYENLGWPLVTTDKTIEEIQQARVRANLPTFTRAGNWLSPYLKAFPIINALLKRVEK